MTKLLEWGADPNALYGPTRMAPLHMACSWHRPVATAALLQSGADPVAADVNGLGPLHCAAIYGDVASLRALVVRRPATRTRFR